MTSPASGSPPERLNPPHLRFDGMSQAVLTGDTLMVSGQVALAGDGGLVGEEDTAVQARQALANLAAVLELADLAPADVVKYTCYLTQKADFAAFREARSQFFGAHEPAATTVVVAALLDPRMLVEIEAVAVRSTPGAAT